MAALVRGDRAAMPGLRFALLVAAAGAAAALTLTHPLALHLATSVLEDGTYDAYQFIWNIWWVGESLLRRHANPFFTRLLFYPEGVSLLFHTFSSPLGLVSVPLQVALPGGPVTAHNVLVIAAPALTLAATALLAREVTGDPWAALAAGLVATLNAALVWFLPVIYLSCFYLIALVLWAWWRMQRRRRAGDVLLLLALLATLVLTSQEYAMMTLALLALDTAGRLTAPRLLGLEPPWWRGTLAAWAVAALALGALARLALRDPATPPPLFHLMLGSGYLAGFVTPPWLTPPLLGAFWAVIFVGTAPLLLLPLAIGCAGRRAGFWLLAAVLTLLMAAGPFVGFQHVPIQGTGLDRAPPGHVPGPYYLALQVLPLLRFFRAPYRWVVATQVALAVLVALGVAGLRGRLARPPIRRAVTAALLLGIVTLAALDVRGLRAPIAPAVVSPAYAALRDDPQPAAVMELPAGQATNLFAAFSSVYMFNQTAHGKFLLDGTVSRLPPGLRPLAARPVGSFEQQPWVKWVVIHRDLLAQAFPATRRQVEQVEALLATQGALVARDGPVEVYRLHTFRPESVR